MQGVERKREIQCVGERERGRQTEKKEATDLK